MRRISQVLRIIHRGTGKAQLKRRFEEMKQQTVERHDANGRQENNPSLAVKLEELRQSFEGASELCYFHAELIVRLRRGIGVATSWATFSSLWEEEPKYLCETLNSRWLISALDTYADYGSSLQQAHALIQIAFFNVMRLAETERATSDEFLSFTELPELDRQKICELWDGVNRYNVRRGDMVWNMLARIRRALNSDPILLAIFETLLARALRDNTLISRVAQISENSRREKRRE
jgi:hypothetical protein